MKPIVKKVLLLAWLIVCTVAFVYFATVLIKYTSIAIEQLSYYKAPNAAEVFPGMDIDSFIKSQTQGIAQNISLIIFLAAIYASFLALAVPKTVALFRNHELKTE